VSVRRGTELQRDNGTKGSQKSRSGAKSPEIIPKHVSRTFAAHGGKVIARHRGFQRPSHWKSRLSSGCLVR
jgi:hypothetical protein